MPDETATEDIEKPEQQRRGVGRGLKGLAIAALVVALVASAIAIYSLVSLQATKTDLNHARNRISAMESSDGTTVDDVSADLDQVKSDVDDLSSRMDDAEGRLDDAEGRLDYAEARVDDACSTLQNAC